MDYIELTCRFPFSAENAERMISTLAAIGFEGFIEESDHIKAYIPADAYQPLLLESISTQGTKLFKVEFSAQIITEQNWNQEWESAFRPVLFGDRCQIRASFHQPVEGIPYDIIIEPKMSFGTAHHETTALMIEYLFRLDIKGKTILDMGCGTGVLAILAKKMGAAEITAIDNDHRAVENTIENARKNNIIGINVYLADASGINTETYDLILANINRNVLMKDMPLYTAGLKRKGELVVSGFFKPDVPLVTNTASTSGLRRVDGFVKGEWAAVRFSKQDPEI